MDGSRELGLVRLLEEAKRAHATAPDDGHHWFDWYADHLASRVGPYLGGPVDRDTLASWLAGAERAHNQEAPDTPWPEFYARFLIDAHLVGGGGDDPSETPDA